MNGKELHEHIEAFRAYNESRALAVRTISGYTKILRYFSRWFIDAHGEGAEVTGRHVREFLAHKRREGKTPATVQTYWAVLNCFFVFLVLDMIIPEDLNPMRLVKVPRCPLPDIRPLTNDQTHALLDSFNKNVPTQYRNYVMCALMLDSGLRVGEVVPLTISDIDLDKGTVRVMGKGRKPRTGYIGKGMRRLLRAYIRDGRPGLRRDECKSLDTLFPASNGFRRGALTREYVSHIVTKKMDEVGIPRNHSSCHRLRHTMAVNFIRLGGSAFHLQGLLGHSSLEMTMRYVRLADGDLQQAHSKCSPFDSLDLQGEEDESK